MTDEKIPGTKVRIDDVNAVLGAGKVNSKVDIDGKGSPKIIKNNIITPTGQIIHVLAGKKLKRQISVVRDRKNIVFEKGTTWESISSLYKIGPEAMQWDEKDFE